MLRTADSGLCVPRLKTRGERYLVKLVRHAPNVMPGEYTSAFGNWVTDREHGRQFRAVFVKIAAPNTLSGIQRYLGSGTVKGTGPVYVSGLVDGRADGRSHSSAKDRPRKAAAAEDRHRRSSGH
ncbi:MAG: hypothetical protein IH627_08940 [Rubrivivax sp.]|nr:hypothetical protein [Rubrivivax sp.]